MQLTLPALDCIPIFTAIPFTLDIVTISKPMKHGDTPTDEPIFPAPPLNPETIELHLVRYVKLRARSWTEDGHDQIASLGGLGDDAHIARHAVLVDDREKVWAPLPGQDTVEEKKQKGSWKQQVTFRSSLSLACPPSFQSENMSVSVCI